MNLKNQKHQMFVENKLLNLEHQLTMENKLNLKCDENIADILNSLDGMNSSGSNQTPRLYYGTEEINTFQTEKFNYTEFINVKEILDYWRELYKDQNLNISERNKIIEQI
ncbi:hypothetical protein LguiA_034915 [Lonicera macranthoides]